MEKKNDGLVSWQIRQGDVFVERLPDSEIPHGYRPVPEDPRGAVLAEGEATGHHHRIRTPGVCLLRAEGIHERVMMIGGGVPAMLVHEEHAEIEIPPGTYAVSQQVEYDWFAEASRVVAD